MADNCGGGLVFGEIVGHHIGQADGMKLAGRYPADECGRRRFVGVRAKRERVYRSAKR
jgi:hypothetical protein